MSNFDKMIKLIEEKDIKGMEEWLHPDFLFVVDYEMEREKSGLRKQNDYLMWKTIFLFLILSYCTRMKMLWSTKASTLWKVSKEHQ